MKSYETRNIAQLQQCIVEGEPYQLHLFWRSHLGQWTKSPFVVNSVTYPTAEHWMMAKKAELFNDKESLDAILATTSPKEAKDLGRGVKGFNPEIWNSKCEEIVTYGNYYKFSQHPNMKQMLMDTGDKVLVEASPYDLIWGIGFGENDSNAHDPLKWRGKNLLGFSLMETRKLLAVESL